MLLKSLFASASPLVQIARLGISQARGDWTPVAGTHIDTIRWPTPVKPFGADPVTGFRDGVLLRMPLPCRATNLQSVRAFADFPKAAVQRGWSGSVRLIRHLRAFTGTFPQSRGSWPTLQEPGLEEWWRRSLLPPRDRAVVPISSRTVYCEYDLPELLARPR